MPVTRTFPVWRGQIVTTVKMGLREFRADFFAIESRDFFPWPMDLDGFTTGPSDYDSPSDEVYCPCGATLPGWDGTAGHLLRLIHHHCETSGHPKPRYEP